MKYNNNHIPHIPFYFVRHGETDWNKDNKIQGQSDIPLNAMGIQQAHAIGQTLQYINISHIVSSPLKRAIQTADIIASATQNSFTVINEFMQNHFGIWEGKSKEEFVSDTGIKNVFEHYKAGGHIESTEPWLDFVSRISIGLRCALTHYKEPILIVAHKPTYWAIAHILNAHIIETEAKNCGVYFFTPPNADSDQWKVQVLLQKTNF